MASNEGKVAIIVAIIGLVGVFVTAIVPRLPARIFGAGDDSTKSNIIKTEAAPPVRSGGDTGNGKETARTDHGKASDVASVSKKQTTTKTVPQVEKKEDVNIARPANVEPLNSDEFCNILRQLNSARKSKFQELKDETITTTATRGYTEYAEYSTKVNSSQFTSRLVKFVQEGEDYRTYRFDMTIKNSYKSLFKEICTAIENCFGIELRKSISARYSEGFEDFGSGGSINVQTGSGKIYVEVFQDERLKQ